MQKGLQQAAFVGVEVALAQVADFQLPRDGRMQRDEYGRAAVQQALQGGGRQDGGMASLGNPVAVEIEAFAFCGWQQGDAEA